MDNSRSGLTKSTVPTQNRCHIASHVCVREILRLWKISRVWKSDFLAPPNSPPKISANFVLFPLPNLKPSSQTSSSALSFHYHGSVQQKRGIWLFWHRGCGPVPRLLAAYPTLCDLQTWEALSQNSVAISFYSAERQAAANYWKQVFISVNDRQILCYMDICVWKVWPKP